MAGHEKHALLYFSRESTVENDSSSSVARSSNSERKARQRFDSSGQGVKLCFFTVELTLLLKVSFQWDKTKNDAARILINRADELVPRERFLGDILDVGSCLTVSPQVGAVGPSLGESVTSASNGLC
jgi:hypothetical protein